MRIRAFTIADYDAARALWDSMPNAIGVGRSDTRAEIEKKLVHDPDLILVAEDKDKIAGTVIGGFDGRRGLIYHLAVDEKFRGHGLGNALMNEIEKRLSAIGCLRVYLIVKRENASGLEFYKRIGWEEMPVVLMAKNIN